MERWTRLPRSNGTYGHFYLGTRVYRSIMISELRITTSESEAATGRSDKHPPPPTTSVSTNLALLAQVVHGTCSEEPKVSFHWRRSGVKMLHVALWRTVGRLRHFFISSCFHHDGRFTVFFLRKLCELFGHKLWRRDRTGRCFYFLLIVRRSVWLDDWQVCSLSVWAAASGTIPF